MSQMGDAYPHACICIGAKNPIENILILGQRDIDF